jgi:catechol 2,3-dioxygenase-like lactoylglutathione lyase family enzyme
MIDHIQFRVSSLDRSKAFYEQILRPLGYALFREHRLPSGGGAIGFGRGGKPDFWIVGNWPVGDPVHVAFSAASRALVRDFHAHALVCGARGNGAPGLRAHYHPAYYGAFILDPDGHNIEAVCHLPET